MEVGKMPWWEREKLLTPKDKEAIQKAIQTYYADIDENWAETEQTGWPEDDTFNTQITIIIVKNDTLSKTT